MGIEAGPDPDFQDTTAGLRRTKNSEPHDPKSQIHAAVGVGIQPIALYRSTSKWPTALTLPHMAGM
jgi:hypothetical protein